MFENKVYFKTHRYRDPDDYAVKSYVMPKIKFMEDNGCFRDRSVSILDVGAGNGTFSRYFKQYSRTIVSTDYSEQLLKDNSCRLKVRADAHRLPFEDGWFDIVFEANLLHHVDKPASIIEEMIRCSSEYLVFIEPNRYNPLMFLFGAVVQPERGTILSCRGRWQRLINYAGITIIATTITGMISQQNTPKFLVPLLKIFDFNFIFGEYIVFICKKRKTIMQDAKL